MVRQSKWSEKAGVAQRGWSATARRLLPPLLVAALLGACERSGPEGTAQLRPKVLLIGIDGVRPDVLTGVPTPNLDGLIGSGAYTAETTTTTPSVSGPSWSSMLTGVWIQPADEKPGNGPTDSTQCGICESKNGDDSFGGQVLGHLDIAKMCGHKTACDVGRILHHAGFRFCKVLCEQFCMARVRMSCQR